VGARFSAPAHTGLGAYPDSCTMGTGSYPGVESGRSVTLTPHLLVPRSKKQSRAIPLLSLRAFVACKMGETYLYKDECGLECVVWLPLRQGQRKTTKNHCHCYGRNSTRLNVECREICILCAGALSLVFMFWRMIGNCICASAQLLIVLRYCAVHSITGERSLHRREVGYRATHSQPRW
jgi:hypothetical protein